MKQSIYFDLGLFENIDDGVEWSEDKKNVAEKKRMYSNILIEFGLRVYIYTVVHLLLTHRTPKNNSTRPFVRFDKIVEIERLTHDKI